MFLFPEAKFISKSGKTLGLRLTFTKKKKSWPTDSTRKLRVGLRQTNNFLTPG